MLENLNNYYFNIKYTIETIPQKFLDAKIIYEDNQIKTKVHRNERKVPVYWTSKFPKHYQQNVINADLTRAAWIASTFTEELPRIKQKFPNADYPLRFVNSIIRQFNKKCNGNTQDDCIIPLDLFDIPKPIVLAEILYCPRMKHFQNDSLKSFMNLPITHMKLG